MCRGPPADDEQSIAAHLMRTRDDKGRPIPRVRLWSEMSMFFFAGLAPYANSGCASPLDGAAAERNFLALGVA